METKNDNLLKLSFLVSSNKIIILEFNPIELCIFQAINGKRNLDQISELLHLSNNEVLNFLKFLKNKGVIYFLKNQEKKSNTLYDRHDLFYEMKFGIKNISSKILSKKKILLVGLGGIGNNILLLIIRMGIKKIILLDDDVIELSNLTRQFFFNKEDIGKLKSQTLHKKIKLYDESIEVEIMNKKFNKKIYSDLQQKLPIDFAFLSADSPQTIALDAYDIFLKLNIPYTTVGYLNDFSISGPILENANTKYKNFIDGHRKNKKNQILNNFNDNYQSPSFGPINTFSSSLAVIDMVNYFVNKKECLSLNKRIVFNMTTLEKIDINFQNLKIGVFSSSSGIAFNYQERVKKTKHFFEEMGLDIILGYLWDKNNNYVSGTITNRAKEFNDLLNKSNILMSMVGGFNSSSILSFIDYEKIRKDKIKIVGFSDTTAILLAVYKKTNIPTYYGPAFLPSFLENDYIKKWNFNLFNDIIINDKKIQLSNPDFYTEDRIDWSLSNTKEYKKVMKKNKLLSFNPAIIEGRLIGGNLNTMVSIYNTEFMPEIIEGDILFIEDSYKRADECERNFAFLKNSKILDKISGLIIGKCEHFDDQGANIAYHELLLKFIDRKIPIIANYDCSHTLPMNVLKIGGKIKMNAIKKTITLLT